MTDTYDASHITVLEGLQPVRERPAMYIGSTDTRGLHHLVYEVVDNSIDEALAGFCNRISVVINKDGSLLVEDNGRGIPVDTMEKNHKSALEVVLTVPPRRGKIRQGDLPGFGWPPRCRRFCGERPLELALRPGVPGRQYLRDAVFKRKNHVGPHDPGRDSHRTSRTVPAVVW